MLVGTWDASNHYLTCTTATGTLTKQNSDASCDLWFSYYDGDTSSASYNCEIYLRKYGSDYLHLTIYRDRMLLYEHLDGGCNEEDIATVLDTNSSATTSQGVWYDVRVHYHGANITVWRAQRGSGNMMSQVLTTSSATSNSTTFFNITTNGSWRFDDIRLVSSSLTSKSAFTYDTSDRMTTMTDNMTTTFYYDYSGRQKSKNAQSGAHTASYTYRYDSKMCTASSSFPDESNLTLSYDGLGKLRQSAGTATNKYRWDAGWNLINIEGGDGMLQNTVWYQPPQNAMAPLGMAAGTNPSSGATWGYFLSDHINSIRETRLDDRTLSSEYEYTPYGNDYFRNGSPPAFGFKGNRHFDELYADYSASGLYFSDQANSDTPAQANSDSDTNPTNNLGKNTGIYVCTRPAWGLQFDFDLPGIPGVNVHRYHITPNHVYFYDSRPNARYKTCSTGSSMGFGNPRDRDDDITDGHRPSNCTRIEKSEGDESSLLSCCRSTANSPVWVPGTSDCHTALKNCVEDENLKWPPGIKRLTYTITDVPWTDEHWCRFFGIRCPPSQ